MKEKRAKSAKMPKSTKSQESAKWVLEFIKQNLDHPMKTKDLAKQAGVKQADYTPFRKEVKRLLDEGTLVRLKRGRIGLPDKMDLITGTLSTTRAGFGFLNPDNNSEEIFVPAHALLAALDGDRVMLRLKPGVGFKGKREGIVLKIIERSRSQLVGTYMKSRGYEYVVPDDRKIQREILIKPGKIGKIKNIRNGEKVVIELSYMDDPNLHPEGVIVERLGLPGDPGVDMLSIIKSHNLPGEFSDQVLAEADDVAESWQQEADRRKDLSSHNAFTIDPATAKDHDDAVSIESNKNGFRLGVHIADVSHFVTGGSELDKEAFERGTSVYFPDRVIPMLPEKLSNDICSLKPNRKRLAFSIFIDYDKTGQVKSYELFPSLIKSRAKLSYEEVQSFFDDGSMSDRLERVSGQLTTMRRLAKLLHKRRAEQGSLDFDLSDPKIIVDESGRVVEIGSRTRTESHRLVEEFMLAANRQVARHFFENAQQILYRVHERPDLEKLNAFSDLVERFGYRFPVSPGMPAVDFSRFLAKVKGKPEEGLINELLLRSMKKAVYQPANIGHFGLAFKHYLHFTSPIRRYPDLLVHRLLKALKNKKYPVKLEKKLPVVLAHVGKQTSERERRAMEAEREAIKAKQVEYMADHVGSLYDGIISGVTNFGFFVRLIGPECEGLIRVSALDDDYYRFDEESYSLIGRRHQRRFRLGDPVKVGVMRVDVENRDIDLFLDEEKVQTKKHGRLGRNYRRKKRR